MRSNAPISGYAGLLVADLLPGLRMTLPATSSGRFTIVCALSAPIAASVEPGLGVVGAAFEAAAAAGAFSTAGGALSRLKLNRLWSPTTTLAWHGETQQCDPRSFQLLRSMLARLRGQGLNCKSMDVTFGGRTLELASVDWPNDYRDLEAYPAATPAARDRLWSKSANTSKCRRALFEFRQVLSATEIRSFAAAVNSWVSLLQLGAYAMPVGHPAVTECIFGGVSQFDECTVEVAVDRFMASDGAWAALANIVCEDPHRVNMLSGIEID